MKASLFFFSVACLLPAMTIAQDDVYYIPSKEVRQITNSEGTVISPAPTSVKAQHYEATRDVDEYNRRSVVGSESEQEYAQDSTPVIESTFDDADEVPYTYTKRIMRFYSPHPGVIVSSPYYWDVCYSDPWDVYYDGWAVYVPSYTWYCYAYDPWYYNRWAWRTCWDFTWGWYDPWYSFSYWGWSRPIYWGWHRPYYGPRPGGGRFWAGGGWRRGGFDPGFGPHGGRTFAGRGYAGGRPGFGGRDNGPGMRPMGGHDGGRRLSGVFRSDRMPASARSNMRYGNNGSGTYNAGVRGGGGVSRMGRNGGFSNREGGYNRNTPTYGRNNGNRQTPSYNNAPSRSESRSSMPSNVGRSSSPRSSSTPSFGGGSSRGGSPGFGRGGGGGGVSRGGGGVSRGGRR